MMAKPMMEWVLDTYYQQACQKPTLEKGIKIINGQESEWVEFMERFETRFPHLRLFSLPSILDDDTRTIDLGVEGLIDEVELGYQAIIEEAERREADWYPLKTF